MSRLILAFDVGTSSLRACLFDETARRLRASTAQQSYPLRTDTSGAAELDAAELLQVAESCLNRTMDFYLAQPRSTRLPIGAIGGSCFWHSLMGVDELGNPLTPVYTWADSRCRFAARELRERLDEKKTHAQTGCMLRSSFWPAKLCWLEQAQPETFRRVALWISPGEWLAWRLFGARGCSYSMASGTGLFNINRKKWDASMLKLVKLKPDHLQTVSDSPLPVAHCGKYMEALNGTVLFPFIGDGAASNIGSGATRSGLAAINVGTSAAVRITVPHEKSKAPFGLFRYMVNERQVLIGGAVSNAGNLREWSLKILEMDERRAERNLMRADPGDHGLTVLPFWMSERAPTWPEEMKGCIAGISAATTKEDMHLAMVDSVYHRIAMISDLLPGQEPKFIVSGGIQSSEASMQRMAHVMGRVLFTSQEPEASIRGAAVHVLNEWGIEVEPPPQGTSFEPNRELQAAFLKQRERQKSLEEALSNWFSSY